MPVRRDVAFFALHAEIVVMNIVLSMTTEAGHRQFRSPFHYRSVTRIAIELGVCSIQLELGLVVVEIPDFPIARSMAALALLAEPHFMNIIFLVAAQAFHRDITIRRSGVAFLAFDQCMRSGERKPRTIVIEVFDLPGSLRMTVRASAAQLGLVTFLLIDLLVAGIAVGRRCVLVETSRMAGCACRLGMLAL